MRTCDCPRISGQPCQAAEELAAESYTAGYTFPAEGGGFYQVTKRCMFWLKRNGYNQGPPLPPDELKRWKEVLG